MSDRAIQVYNYGSKTLEAAYWVSMGIEHGRDCVIKSSQPANFVTPIGVYKKRKEIEAKGLPDLRNSRFITLTLDRDQMGDAETGYEVGKRQLRQFMYELRKSLGVTEEECPHAWKLEFHRGIEGWPHWHILFQYKKILPYQLIDACWRLGRTEVKRIDNNGLTYLFKYATKEATLPHYILQMKQVRFWQTSKHFHTSRISGKAEASPRQVDKDSALGTQKRISRKESTLGERLCRWLRTISIRIGSRCAVVEIASFPALLRRAAFQIADDLTFGLNPIEITSTMIKMPAQRAIDFLTPEFSREIDFMAA